MSLDKIDRWTGFDSPLWWLLTTAFVPVGLAICVAVPQLIAHNVVRSSTAVSVLAIGTALLLALVCLGIPRRLARAAGLAFAVAFVLFCLNAVSPGAWSHAL
jgi:hypothetical protein